VGILLALILNYLVSYSKRQVSQTNFFYSAIFWEGTLIRQNWVYAEEKISCARICRPCFHENWVYEFGHRKLGIKLKLT